ncbi:hypothetical protein SEMRO_1742_G294710.1 [Seminavis robusta]|uniref:Uncharacterized protein n=1 Tax=Seminavis robusta TaxID=568900 RepID=A0A9N8EQ01_9STRA|nr:hypothetical protein SEMRO_1742_G294710.1 [Seminavis robusta]|eukprot:Sro1742_g294710.1 n/a (349) ;mRNA; r:1203-2446
MGSCSSAHTRTIASMSSTKQEDDTDETGNVLSTRKTSHRALYDNKFCALTDYTDEWLLMNMNDDASLHDEDSSITTTETTGTESTVAESMAATPPRINVVNRTKETTRSKRRKSQASPYTDGMTPLPLPLPPVLVNSVNTIVTWDKLHTGKKTRNQTRKTKSTKHSQGHQGQPEDTNASSTVSKTVPDYNDKSEWPKLTQNLHSTSMTTAVAVTNVRTTQTITNTHDWPSLPSSSSTVNDSKKNSTIASSVPTNTCDIVKLADASTWPNQPSLPNSATNNMLSDAGSANGPSGSLPGNNSPIKLAITAEITKAKFESTAISMEKTPNSPDTTTPVTIDVAGTAQAPST